MKCKNCKHWSEPDSDALRVASGQHDYANPISEDAPDCWVESKTSLEYADKALGNRVRECKCPSILRVRFNGAKIRIQRPRFTQAAVIDGEDYYSAFLTDEFFGCVHFEPLAPHPADQIAKGGE